MVLLQMTPAAVAVCSRLPDRPQQSQFVMIIRFCLEIWELVNPVSYYISSKVTFSNSRSPLELGGVQSLLPLQNAVAAARMTSCLSTTSRSCRALSHVFSKYGYLQIRVNMQV